MRISSRTGAHIGFLWSLSPRLVTGQGGTVAPGTVQDCTLFTDYPDPFVPQQGNTCASIAEYWQITEQTFIIWNPSVGNDCSNLVEGNSYCIEENFSQEPSNPNPPSATTVSSSRPGSTSSTSRPATTPSTSRPASTTTTSTTTGSSAPSPTQSGLTPDCQRFYFVERGDICSGIVDQYGTFTLNQFYSWNPAVGTSCQGLQAGFHVCVGVQGTPTSRPTTTSRPATTSTSTPSGPQPQQPNVRRDCQRWHLVASGDTCEMIANRYRTFTSQQFISWNPDVGSACTGLWRDYYVCIGIPGTPTTPSSTRPVSTGVATPTPIQPGTISTCNRFVQSSPSGASCQRFSGGNRISLAQLYAWNRVLGVRGENCGSQFRNSMNYCVSVSRPLPPPNNGPVQPGVPNTCWRYLDALPGGTCERFANRAGITLSQLYAWNPVLGNNGQNCRSNFWSGYWYCVQVAG